MHLFILGLPKAGKTTLIKKLVPLIKNADGFYTEEIREKKKRVGFKIKTIKEKREVKLHFPLCSASLKIPCHFTGRADFNQLE